MPSEDQIRQIVKDFSEHNRHKTFAEFIAEMFTGKYVEIYLGDSYEEVSLEQTSTSYPAVFCGRVVAAFKECLIINSAYVEKGSNKMRLGNMILVNERAIRALTEIDGNGIMEDTFLRSRESLSFKENFVTEK